MDDLIVLLKVLNLFHDLFENFGAVLWRIAVFYKADLDLQLQLIADVLIVQPVSKRRFGIDDLFDLLRQSLALVVDDNTVNLFIGSVSISCFLFDRNLLCVAAPRIIRTTVELAILSPAANQKSTALWAYFLLCQNCNIPNHIVTLRIIAAPHKKLPGSLVSSTEKMTCATLRAARQVSNIGFLVQYEHRF